MGLAQAEQAARKKAEELLKASELREKQARAALEAGAADRSATEADKAALAKERQELEQMQGDIISELRTVRMELQRAQQSLNGTTAPLTPPPPPSSPSQSCLCFRTNAVLQMDAMQRKELQELGEKNADPEAGQNHPMAARSLCKLQ